MTIEFQLGKKCNEDMKEMKNIKRHSIDGLRFTIESKGSWNLVLEKNKLER